MRDIAEFDILVQTGIYNSGPDHWQSHWEQAFPTMRRVVQDDWDAPVYADWSRRLSEEVERCARPVLLIAHSLGTSLVMRWGHAARARDVQGAFLVAPSDRDRFDTDPDGVVLALPEVGRGQPIERTEDGEDIGVSAGVDTLF